MPDDTPAPVQPAVSAVKAAATAPDSFSLSLTEFCTRLSSKDKRVELIGAFFSTEKAAGRVLDTEAAFSNRFEAFASAPA